MDFQYGKMFSCSKSYTHALSMAEDHFVVVTAYFFKLFYFNMEDLGSKKIVK